ncbi:MAG TPA: succinate dehydrogenase cytochrome b subunit [Herpetosiphonaceae bacterium]
MVSALTLYRTSIGKKVVMAVTGIILVGFVVAHMVGNLKVFLGAEAINAYAGFLRDVGEPLFPREALLWVARIVLLVSVVLHITAATQLTIQDRASRPQRYAVHKPVQATYASRTMRWGGVIVLLFIIYHILHLTLGQVGFAAGQYLHEDPNNGFQVYANVVNGFRNPLVSLFYIVAMGAVGLHLYHGVWSMFQTLGLNSVKFNSLLRGLAMVTALAVVLGNISIPIAVLTGILR